MRSLNIIDWIALVLLIIGGINWGLVGFFNFNLVDAVIGGQGSNIVYAIVGICALYIAVVCPSFGKRAAIRPQTTSHQPV